MEERDDLKEPVQEQANASSNTQEVKETESKSSKKDKKRGREESLDKELQSKKLEYDILYDKHLRLLSEFDNYRKRTIKERTELLKTAGEEVILSLLPVLDDMERALRHTMDAKDPVAIRDGVQLILNKLTTTLAQKGLQAIEAVGQDFDTDYHEAITDIPAPSEEMKGKVVDETEKGYTLGGKVIRFSKVVVGK